MTIVIRQRESLKNTERQKLFSWGENVFGVADFQLSWRHKDLHFLLYVDRKLVCHVGILQHTININYQSIKIGGVGGVVTVPEEQKKGYAGLLMNHAARFLMSTWEVDFGLLFCLPRMITYYELLGWKLIKQRFLIEQPIGQIISPLQVMVLPCARLNWPDDDIDLQSQPW